MSIPVHDPLNPHNAVWREYTQSLMDNKPKVVECRVDRMGCWRIDQDPGWYDDCEYRIARPMLKLTYSVPMPVTEPLEKNQPYWLADMQDNEAGSNIWRDDECDNRWLRAGLIYLTEADAQAAIDARNAAMTAALEAAK